MDVALAIFGVAFAAFCVWLTVRIVNRRERWAKWTAVALIVVSVLAYPFSYGPVSWLEYNGHMPRPLVNVAYAPLAWIVRLLPESIAAPYREFNTWCQMGCPEPLDP